MQRHRVIVLGVGIFILVIVSLQIFLIMVGLEAWITFDAGVAWGAAIASVALAGISLVLYRYLRTTAPRPGPGIRPPRRQQR